MGIALLVCIEIISVVTKLGGVKKGSLDKAPEQ